MDACGFFTACFGDSIKARARMVIWTLPDKKARWFTDMAQASEYAAARGTSHDVYFGVGLYRGGITCGRGKASDVVCITSLWADVDYGVGRSKNVPKTERDAYRVLERIGIKPSIVIHSGGGLHAYWLLIEPVTRGDGAASLSARWSATVRACANSIGFEVDGVGDLSRVLRVPGTTNHKKGCGRTVRVVSAEAEASRRYDVSDIEPLLVEVAPSSCDPTVIIDIGNDREPPSAKIAAMAVNDRTFRRTWDHERKDLQDQSPSAYDMALAHCGVMAEWSDQEIADLICAFRRRHNLDVKKAHRRDYLAKTIGKARGARKFDFDATVKAKGVGGLLDHVRQQLELPDLRAVEQHGKDSPTYFLLMAEEKRFSIGGEGVLFSFERFRSRLSAASCGKIALPISLKKRWDPIARCLSGIVTYVDDGESEPSERLWEWVQGYLSSHPAFRSDERKEAALSNAAFVHDGHFHFRVVELAKHIRVSGGLRIDEAEVRRTVKLAGMKQKTISLGSTSKSYWCVPIDDIPADFANALTARKND